MFGASSIVAFILLVAAMASKDSDKVKGTAFGICSFRTTLSLLPDEAGALCYDKRTPRFEGVALEFNPDKSAHGGAFTMEGCQKSAADFQSLLKRMSDGEKSWGGLDFNVCRAHTVDDLIVESVAEGSPTKQIVFCGVGQDYRAMRYGEAIRAQDAKVFELDLPPMMALREKVKARICEVNEGLVLPETYALSIDFDKQSISEVLLACPGFDPTLPTLYLWEGVTYYLLPEAMESFLRDIHGLMSRSPANVQKEHSLFFDYLIDLPTLAEKGDVPAAAMLETFANSEPLRSFLNSDNVEPYLSSLGFQVDQEMIPPEIYKPYQTVANGDYRLKGSKYFGMVVAKPK
jgi:methyltransferase (TIGR00027 family)